MKLPILDLDDARTTSLPERSYIIRLPYSDIHDVREQLMDLAIPPAAILPPYSDSLPFTARCAAITRDKLTFPVLVACPVDHRKCALSFIRTLKEDGFKNFALAAQLGVSRVEALYGFIDDDPSLWYHVAGRRPENVEGKKAVWTWSKEEL